MDKSFSLNRNKTSFFTVSLYFIEEQASSFWGKQKREQRAVSRAKHCFGWVTVSKDVDHILNYGLSEYTQWVKCSTKVL